VAVLDGPLRPDGDVGASAAAVDTFALVVAPPLTSSSSPSSPSSAVARGLLLGPAAQAGPPPPQPNTPPLFLLYLVADVSHLPPNEASAEDVLAPVLTRLAKRGEGEEGQDRRPNVLEAVFYSQHGGEDEGEGEGESATVSPPPPSGLVVCPGPDEVAPGVAGYVKAWAAAEALYRRHFPGLPWFGEQRPGAGGGFVAEGDAEDGAAEGGAGLGGGGVEQSSDPPTEGLDAIDELSSALAALGEDLEGGKRG
jgi:hypothetical protein